MTDETRAVWGRYNDLGYALEAVGFVCGGGKLDLVFLKGDQLAGVVIGSSEPTEARWQTARTAFRGFLLARRACGLFVRLDRAWVAGGVTEIVTDACSMHP